MNSDKGELMRRINKPIAAVAAGVILLGTAGVAFAYWTTTGSGSGTGSTTGGVVNQLSFTQNPAGAPDTSVNLAAMYPGDSSQSLSVRVRNTSTTESAYVTSVKAYITTNKIGCTGADFLLGGVAAPSTALTAAALTWTAVDLAAGVSANAASSVQFNNTTANQDACKSAVVTVNYLGS